MPISIQSIDFVWPNGHVLFKNLKLNLDDHQKHGLIGSNGVGKSTLIKLILNQERPTRGHILRDLSVCVFAQSEEPPKLTLGEYLGDVWFIQNPSEKEFIYSYLEDLDLSQMCSDLSGGQWTKCRLLKIISEPSQFIIFDEPTNHLDRDAKKVFIDFFKSTDRGLLVVSHDRELLECVDHIHELSNLGLMSYGGCWSIYEHERKAEIQRLTYEYDRAQKEKKKALRDQQVKIERQDKRMREGRKYADSGSAPKILLSRRKRIAEGTQGKVSVQTEKINKKLSESLEASLKNAKTESKMYAQLNQPHIRGAKKIMEARDLNFMFKDENKYLWTQPLNFILRGNEKLAVLGPNGSGKSTLLKALFKQNFDGFVQEGHLQLGPLKAVFIDQMYFDLSPKKSVLETVLQSSDLPQEEIRNQLAMFLFDEAKVNQSIESLSGGEKLRVSLAKALIQTYTPELIVLDEPTNNLDLNNLEFLEKLLQDFQGALIVVSHDHLFLKRINITQAFTLK